MAEPQVTMEVAKGLAAGIVEQTIPARAGITVAPEVDRAIAAWKANQAETALQMLAGEICPYTKEDVAGVVKENLSSEDRDKKTGQKGEPKSGTPERARYEETLKMAEALRVYLESGGQDIRQPLINELFHYLGASPLFRDLLTDRSGRLNVSLAEPIIKTLLRQPETRKAILRLFTERIDPKKTLEHESIVKQLELEIATLEGQVIDVNQVDQDVQKIRVEIQTKRSQITSDPIYQDYLTLTSNLEDLNDELQTLLDTYKQARINNPQQLQQIVSDISNKKNEIRSKQRELQEARFNNINSNLQEIERLGQELQSLENKKNQAGSQEQKALRMQLIQKKEQLQEAQALLTAERIKYASEIIAIPAEAVKEFLDGALEKAAQHYKEEAAKSAQEKEAEKQRLEQEALRKIGEGLGTKKKKVKVNGITTEVAVPDKKSASELVALLMQPNGLVEFGKKIVDELYSNNTFNTRNSYGLTEAEADLIRDKLGSYDYLKTTGLPLAKAVMANYLRAGGRFSSQELEALGRTDLGKDLINQGINEASQRKQFVEGLVGKDVMRWIDEVRLGHKSVDWLMDKGIAGSIAGGLIAILFLLGMKVFGSSKN